MRCGDFTKRTLRLESAEVLAVEFFFHVGYRFFYSHALRRFNIEKVSQCIRLLKCAQAVYHNCTISTFARLVGMKTHKWGSLEKFNRFLMNSITLGQSLRL